MIGKQIKQLALISGWDDWQNCTNHGLRALGVTTTVCCKDNNLPNKAVLNHTRHANEKSQKPYLRESATNNSSLQDALIGNVDHGKSVKDSDYHNLKRKYDDLQIKQNEYEKERAEKKGWCIIM